MKELSFLEMLNDHPLAGALMLAMLLVIMQIIKAWKGTSSVSRIEQENNKLAKQTSETVNHCATRTHALMEVMEEFIQENDVRHLHSELTAAIHLLEKVHEHTGGCQAKLGRVDSVCRDLAANIERTDSRVVHAQIVNKVDTLEKLLEDVKRITLGNHQ